MLGRKHRTSPPEPETRTACRRAIETLESRQLLSGGHFGPAGGFAMYDRSPATIVPSTAGSDLHVSIHEGAAGGGWGADRGSIRAAGYDRGHDDRPHFDEDPDGRHPSDPDAFKSEARPAPGHVTSEFLFESYFGTDGAADWGSSVSVPASTPFGGESVVVVTTQLVPVKIFIPPSGSTLVVVPPKGPADFGHDPSPASHGPIVRQPALQREKAYTAQAPAEQADQARSENERAEHRQVRQPAARDARPASANAPASAPADSQADPRYSAAPVPAAAAHPAGAAPSEAGRSGGVAAAIAAAAAHVVDVAPAARSAGATIATAAQGAAVAYDDNAASGVWRAIAGRVEAVVAKAVGMVEDVASRDGAFDAVAVAADVGDVGSGLLYLPTGPTMFLGLAPMTAASAQSSWWPSPQAWRVTEAVSLVIALAGYGYCRADAERRRGVRAVAGRSSTQYCIVSTRRPSEGL